MLSVNAVIRMVPDDPEPLFAGFVRYLGSNAEGDAAFIRLDISEVKPDGTKVFNFEKLKAPFFTPCDTVISAVREGRILTKQSFQLVIPKPKAERAEREKKRMAKLLAIMKPILDDPDILFDVAKRHNMFETQATAHNVCERSVRRYYYRYLWGGQTQDALISHYSLCGGLGKQQQSGTQKRGRKRKDGTSGQALPGIRPQLEKGARQLYLPGQYTLRYAYVGTKTKYFGNGLECHNAKLKDVLLPEEEVPTKRQFRYVAEKLEAKEGKRTKIPGRLRPFSKKQERRGKARDGVLGPGYRFEIDPAKLQNQLVSRVNRAKLIGTPAIYAIVDVWSGMYVGYELSIENCGWPLAAKALRNCFTPKAEVFERLGLPYDNSDWPCHHLPVRLAADRAEFVSDKAGVVPEIGVIVEIMESYRPDQKGTVESSIKNIKHRHPYKIPGTYPKFPKRGEPDGKNDGCLTSDELEMIIVEIIIDLNNEPVPLEYIPPELLESGETDISHVGLYRWGLKHYPGHTRELPEDILISACLTKGTASITDGGIHFRGLTYHPKAGYVPKPQLDETGKLEIRYDEHKAGIVYFCDAETGSWQPAITDNQHVLRTHMAFYEWEAHRKQVEPMRQETFEENCYKQQKKVVRINKMTKAAKKEASAARKGLTKTETRKDMTKNRQLEKAANRMANNEELRSALSLEPTSLAKSPAISEEKDRPALEDKAKKTTVAKRTLALWKET